MGVHMSRNARRGARPRMGGARHDDAIAIGEAEATWPQIVEDAAARPDSRTYCAGGGVEMILGQERKPTLQHIQRSWETR